MEPLAPVPKQPASPFAPFASANNAATSLVAAPATNYGAILAEPARAGKKPAVDTSALSISTSASPCSRCKRIISGCVGGSSASSITRAEAVLVPQLVAAQVSDADLREVSRRQGPAVAAFYEAQNALIADMLGVNKQHTDDVLESQSELRRQRQRQVDRAVRVSVVANVAVVAAQLYAAVSSGSLALFATMSEASMDLLSSVILLLASVAARRNDRFSLYPTGRFKLETIGVIVFAVLMGAFSVVLLGESVAALIANNSTPNNLSIYDAACVIAAVVAKAWLYWYCYTLREYHAAHVLMTDHKNDVMVNAFGLTMAVVGRHAMPWMDPLGSLIIALMILRSWVGEAWDQIKLIVGIRADPRLLQVLTFTALTHDPRIEKVDRVVAYHSGAKLFVEVDIVMPPATPLVVLHDVAESLQEKYERMPGVGRCYVHVDYETEHRPEHQNALA
ncbi:hypothetical protein LPJ61_002866 [Coemansia biformis]|uniref:Cation efflux protein transmembrane domain-containing protein n=1 Tax=Coemansia biformis TaxID=1286918 RepID=A0A9W8CY92_9FUNG|nr:hypothetical protein LPJ61_002866 [Coemansia biformis]